MEQSYTLVALLLLVCVSWCSATSYNVGESVGWQVGMDMEAWARTQKFLVGDKLVFHYTPELHTVTEVTRNEYKACMISNYIDTDTSGTTTVTLDKPGRRYFICGLPDHCDAGMRMIIKVILPGNAPPAKTKPEPEDEPEGEPEYEHEGEPEPEPSSASTTVLPISATLLLSTTMVLFKLLFF